VRNVAWLQKHNARISRGRKGPQANSTGLFLPPECIAYRPHGSSSFALKGRGPTGLGSSASATFAHRRSQTYSTFSPSLLRHSLSYRLCVPFFSQPESIFSLTARVFLAHSASRARFCLPPPRFTHTLSFSFQRPPPPPTTALCNRGQFIFRFAPQPLTYLFLLLINFFIFLSLYFPFSQSPALFITCRYYLHAALPFITIINLNY
jgi:hypothetical protein